MSLRLQLRSRKPPLDFAAALPAGKITALLGPSGSGKTSILRAIAGLLPLQTGSVRIHDETWCDRDSGMHLPARQRPVGFVSQNVALFPHLTALGNVEMALQHLPASGRGKRARYCLALTRVEELAARYPRELSGGQMQRVALARAIAREPKVLLLDEPFSAVDRNAKKSLYIELLRLHETLSTTIIVVTHDLDEAAQITSHMCLVHEGRLLQAGATNEVLARPCCEEAARLLDIPNIFDGRFEVHEAGGAVLRWGPHQLHLPQTAPADVAAARRWAIQPANVLLVRPDKPWSDQLENPLSARVTERMDIGTDSMLWLEPAGLQGEHLQMRVPVRALQRYSIGSGQPVTVCLRSADIVPLQVPVPVQPF